MSVPRGGAPLLNLPPLITRLLIALIAVHALRGLLPHAYDLWVIRRFAFIPQTFDLDYLSYDPWALITPITYQFLHGNIGHLLMNGFGLVLFGTLLARSFRAGAVLSLYLLCGVVGAFTEALLTGSGAVLIGASAAVSGLVGASARALYEGRAFGIPTQALPPFMAIWLAFNVLPGLIPGLGGGIAYLAHGGGFVAGLALYPVLLRRA